MSTTMVDAEGRKRERRTGRYAYSDMDRLCACGHVLGRHTAEHPFECIAGDFEDISCECERFRPVRRREPSAA